MPTADENYLLTALTGQGLDPVAARALFEGLEGNDTRQRQTAVLGPRRASRRREKVFGLGRPRALDRNSKTRIMHWARCLSRRTEKGRAYGQLTAKAVAVLESLLWVFHNNRSGLCFPSYETIAAAAHCARSSITGALQALEEAGILSWVHRLKRVRVACQDLFGGDGVRMVPQRTSNAYHFNDPGTPAGRPNPPEANFQSGTANQGSFSSVRAAFGGDRTAPTAPKEAFGREGGGPRGRFEA
jgi:hypothetical protein